jgi:hypothetical protein
VEITRTNRYLLLAMVVLLAVAMAAATPIGMAATPPTDGSHSEQLGESQRERSACRHYRARESASTDRDPRWWDAWETSKAPGKWMYMACPDDAVMDVRAPSYYRNGHRME